MPLRDTDHRVPGVGTTVTWDQARAARMFAAIRADRPLAPAARTGAARTSARTAGTGGEVVGGERELCP